MVFGSALHFSDVSSNGRSVMLRAEELYTEHGPSRAVLQNVAFRLWTGNDPADVAADPAKGLPDHGIKGLEPTNHHEKKTVFFQEEDMGPWCVFTLVFVVLVLFDNVVLHRKNEKLSLLKAILYTTFWIAVAGMFNVYVYMTRGVDDAFQWGTGYLLEWMLSVDNLFVFHRIFIIFKTPDDQKHKPLFYGIIGAIVFRMIFFLLGEVLINNVSWMHLVFGLFLVYTGYKAVSMDDDDDAPDKGWLFNYIIQYISYVDRYDDQGRFFVPVEEDKRQQRKDLDSDSEDNEKPLSARSCEAPVEVKFRATRLVLVVVCLEVTDLIFAVDSVSAIVAQIPDLFLAYTACVFAMLGLRAMFFAIDELVKMFALLAYGVAFILVFIGVKLILRSWIHIPAKIVCCILVGTLVFSILASLVKDKWDKEHEEDDYPREDSEGSAPPECTASARANV